MTTTPIEWCDSEALLRSADNPFSKNSPECSTKTLRHKPLLFAILSIMTTRFGTQNHRIGYVRMPGDYWDNSPVRVVQAGTTVHKPEATQAPLEELGDVRLQLSEADITRGLETLIQCKKTKQKLRTKERQILMMFYEGEVHRHPSINLPSFQQFLCKNFTKAEAELYLKELAVGRKEKLLNIPIGTYTIYQFKILERFRCYVSNGSKRDERGVFRAEAVQFGVKENPVQIQRLKECWELAQDSARHSLPDAKHINEAVAEMEKRYPEYQGRKPISTVNKLKLKIQELETENQQLKDELARLHAVLNEKAS